MRNFYLILGCFILTYLSGCFVFPMDIDAAQYASMSMEMLQTGNYLQVTNGGVPYLDKPPLIFWLSSLSMAIFGFSSFAFKLPSVLVSMLGVYSLYQIGKIKFNVEVARYSVLILLSSVGFILMNSDVRTDALLTGFVIFSVWKFLSFQSGKSWVDFIGMSLGIALAMLSKGPLGLIIPAMFIFLFYVVEKLWREIFHWRWLCALLIIMLVLLPMCIGLYLQHGWHGVKFYFWTQSFGRITGESEWKNHTGYFYFIEVLGWSYLPFLVLLIPVIFSLLKKTWQINRQNIIWWIVPVLVTIALSFSKYKLPHYVFVTFPFWSMAFAIWLDQQQKQKETEWFLKMIQWVFIIVIVAGLTWFTWIFAPHLLILTLLLFLAGAGMFWYVWKSGAVYRIAFSFAVLGLYMNFLFYPSLLKYQGTSEAGNYLRSNEINKEQLMVCMKYPSYAMSYAYRNLVPVDDIQKMNPTSDIFLVLDKDAKKYIEGQGMNFKVDTFFVHYSITRLKPKFIQQKTRAEKLDTLWIGSIE